MAIRSPFNQMLCVRSDDHFYTLVFIYSATLPEKTRELVTGKTVNKILKEIAYTMGYMEESWKNNNMIVNHVEIIIPPGGEYLLLEERLKDWFLEKRKTLSVKVGVFIPIPKGNIRKNIKMIDGKIETLAIKDFGNN